MVLNILVQLEYESGRRAALFEGHVQLLVSASGGGRT